MTSDSERYTLSPHPAYGFLRVHPTPGADEIAAYYADEFYSGDYKRLNDSGLDVQLADKEFYDSQRADVCREVAEIAGRPVDAMSVLDVGCGWGQALLYFRSQGMVGAGFDPAPEAVEYARSHDLDVVHAGVDRMGVFSPRRFDVVTLFNVLEHLADPVSVVEEIASDVLVPGGILVIDVPNEFNRFQLCAEAVLGLPRWWVAPPAHLNYFSGTSLRGLLEGTGYEVVLQKASFPLEMFLLFGENYVGDPELGRSCHERRMRFEANLRANDDQDLLDRFSTWLAANDLGRQIVAYARLAG